MPTPTSVRSDASEDGAVDDEMLAEIEMAESELRRLGLGSVRVTQHGGAAWLRMPVSDIALVAAEPLRGAVLIAVRTAGFERVAIDLAHD